MSKRVSRKTLDAALGAVDTTRLGNILGSLWNLALQRSYNRVGAQLGERVVPRDKTEVRMRDLVGEQIKGIEETTRARVQDYVERALKDEMSIGELVKLIQADPSGAFGRSRATTIARTETALSYAHSSVAGWRDSGRVEKVVIFDGDGCGWSGHGDGDLANGSIRTLDDYEAHPIAHPRCVRSAAPHIEL